VDESEHSGHFARIFPPSSREAFEALGPLAEAAAASNVGALSVALAARLYGGADEATRRAALVAEQDETAEDLKRWDWYGLEGHWRQAKAAVREENRALMDSIRAARNLPAEEATVADLAEEPGESVQL